MSKFKQRQLDALYERLPKLECKGLCHTSCGPVFMSYQEWKRIKDRLGHSPKGGADCKCPMLTADNRCSVYDIRPTICRLWGTAEGMPCVYVCEPERVVPDDEAKALLLDAEMISHGRAG